MPTPPGLEIEKNGPLPIKGPPARKLTVFFLALIRRRFVRSGLNRRGSRPSMHGHASAMGGAVHSPCGRCARPRARIEERDKKQ
jgi:hypothetical protein